MPNTITGSCVCEKVRYELTGSPITNIICHCDTCRKITGSVFMANSAYTRETFSKSTTISPPDSRNTIHRHFCSNCGSPVYTTSTGTPGYENMLTVTAGTMDIGNNSWKPSLEVFCMRRRGFLNPFEGTDKHEKSPESF
ncbi:hypothetical protein N7509_003615 [Penicillium cosmopolitanum]|uniref:CENP-V/GFA domain-containing protein n=1 Tax=Penicillium cosmopolitanum TaxID=1131564 RepID=A0A9W9W5B2_9EURO|nr:uncharacterized protein N7509_003615 [Penicillium cosmopolitanum]KAJ5403744.1 hypothetical protein N7509_003615 [Penicillium cosmopolitanum]